MKKLLLVIINMLFVASNKAQDPQNVQDLDFLYNAIQKLPSFKDQLKGDKAYQQLYKQIRKDIRTSNEFETFQKLMQLIAPIKDNHLGLWRKADSSLKFNYLNSGLNLSGVEARYKAYPKDSIEGVYIKGNIDKLYLLSLQAKNMYHLINLQTGTTEAILNRTGAQSADAILFAIPPVPYALYRNVKLINGKLSGLNYRKMKTKENSVVKLSENKYEYKVLEPEIGYLRLGTFSSNSKNIKVASEFFQSVEPTIKTRQLIVDLRDNGGGGFKTSDQFLRFLKKYKGLIFLLQNSNTVSNAEQFILSIKNKKGLTTFGETTRGTISYGSNYGKTITLPSSRFVFYPTDMSGRSRYLVYENTGIKPDVPLEDSDEDWIIQTIKYIKANQEALQIVQ